MARPLEERWVAARPFDRIRDLPEQRDVERPPAVSTVHAMRRFEVAVRHHHGADAIEIVEAADEVARGERGKDDPVRRPEEVSELRAMAGDELERLIGLPKPEMREEMPHARRRIRPRAVLGGATEPVVLDVVEVHVRADAVEVLERGGERNP